MASPTRRWLSDFTTIYDTLATLSCIKNIVRDIIKIAGKREPLQDIVETLFIAALHDNAQLITSELIAAVPVLQDLQPVVNVTFTDIKGRYSSADIEMVLTHTDSKVSRIPVNIKVEREATSNARAVSLMQLLSYLTVKDYTFNSIVRGEPDAILLGLICGTTKLISRRDYALFIVNVKTRSIEMRSLISRLKLNDNSLALYRQNNRDVVCYTSPVGNLISTSYDIARELAYALLPNDSASRFITNVIKQINPNERQAVAKTLQSLDYREVMQLLSLSTPSAIASIHVSVDQR